MTADTATDTIRTVNYALPDFDNWHAGTRDRLEATVYVDTFPVGRGVHVTGSVTLRTAPHLGAGWHPAGSYLYRVEADGSGAIWGALDPTETMRGKVYAAAADVVRPPTPGLRLKVAREAAERRNRYAREEYARTVADTARLAGMMAEALGVQRSEILADTITEVAS